MTETYLNMEEAFAREPISFDTSKAELLARLVVVCGDVIDLCRELRLR
jgi:hypothetical protein